MSNRGQKRNSNRYFDEINSQSAPGILSKELRKALGLNDDMLPIWIYKMRVLGYPPGWVKQAEIQPNLDIIGDEQAKPRENNVEDGEIQPIVYDESATIEYPGYNASFPKHVKDDWLLLGYPPFRPPPVRQNPGPKQNPKVETPKSSQSTETPSTSTPIKTSANDSQAASSSSIAQNTDEEPVIQAFEDIEGADSQEDVQTLDDSVISTENPESLSDQACENGENNETGPVSEDANTSVSIVSESATTTPTRSKRKFTVIQGESGDSYQFKRTKLPDLAKWAEGVKGELVQFENLPNATGNFRKIKDVLSTYRSQKVANGEQKG